MADSIAAKRDPFNIKQSWCTSIIPQYLCQGLAEWAFKRSWYEMFQSNISTNIFALWIYSWPCISQDLKKQPKKPTWLVLQTVNFNLKTYRQLFWCFLHWWSLFLWSCWTCWWRRWVVQSFIFLFSITLTQNLTNILTFIGIPAFLGSSEVNLQRKKKQSGKTNQKMNARWGHVRRHNNNHSDQVITTM